jgi:hypothetical protein
LIAKTTSLKNYEKYPWSAIKGEKTITNQSGFGFFFILFFSRKTCPDFLSVFFCQFLLLNLVQTFFFDDLV